MVAERTQSDCHGRWWTMLPDGRIECRLCPRFCKLNEGQRGFCFVRQRVGARMMLTTYGRSSGFCVDPIEKKPLNHFLPGTSVLSFGTAGCNLGCRFCQNWDISKARKWDKLADTASPAHIALAAERLGCRSVAFTYNDPVIFAEYAIDVAQACRERGIKTVAVTAGYITDDARPEFYRHMDAANVDLKAFTEAFYHRLCFARLDPVLDTLRYLRHETDVWFEVTTLLIPGENDSETELHLDAKFQFRDLRFNALRAEGFLKFFAAFFGPNCGEQDQHQKDHQRKKRERLCIVWMPVGITEMVGQPGFNNSRVGGE